MWLDELKIAILEKDIKRLDELINNLPTLEKKNDINEAKCLMSEAKKIVVSLKNDTEHSMNKIKKNIEFLSATEAPAVSSLDLIS